MQDGCLLAIRRFLHNVHARKQVGVPGFIDLSAAFLRPERRPSAAERIDPP